MDTLINIKDCLGTIHPVKEKQPGKIVQITSSGINSDIIYVLCEDGCLYELSGGCRWTQIPHPTTKGNEWIPLKDAEQLHNQLVFYRSIHSRFVNVINDVINKDTKGVLDEIKKELLDPIKKEWDRIIEDGKRKGYFY